MRLLLLGAFIGAATVYVLFTLRAQQDDLSLEAADRIWQSVFGDRDVRTDALVERVH